MPAAIGSLVTADAGTAEGTQEERGGRRRRRRRGRGGRGEEVAAGMESGVAAEVAEHEVIAPVEISAEEPAAVVRRRPSLPSRRRSRPRSSTARPEMIRVAADIADCAAGAAGRRAVKPVLELAGLMLVQTAPDKHARLLLEWRRNPCRCGHRASARRRRPSRKAADQVETRRQIEQRAER
jgi:hypothetical protein